MAKPLSLRVMTMVVCAAALVPVAGMPVAGAQTVQPPTAPPSRPVTQSNPSAQDVAETPLTDLNVKKGVEPEVLKRAVANPYGLGGLKSCPAIIREVGLLNSVLGDDVDIAGPGKRHTTAGHVAQSVVGSFIPFRGVIREVSGASAEERRMQALIRAGMARRGFLKGIGMTRGCHYPARPG